MEPITDSKWFSPLAHPYEKLKRWQKRTAPIFGLCVHTMGTDPWDVAKRLKIDPFEWVVSYYARPDAYGPHYAINRDGTIIQISSEEEKAAHVGLTAKQREMYLSGAWEKTHPRVFARWKENWLHHNHKSPSHLYPGPSPNNVYIGVELLPDKEYGVFFTDEQYKALRALWIDIRLRHGLVAFQKERFLGHEDLNPLDRWSEGGGWDPGALREKPFFDWKAVW